MWMLFVLASNNKTHNTKIGVNQMSSDLEGAKIVKIREMTTKEANAEGWELYRDGCRVLVLSNGINLYASQDYEGNGPGALFFTEKGKHYAI